MDGQRILKLLPETPCAARAMGVEISVPPGTGTGEGETRATRQRETSGFGKEWTGATGEEETPSQRCGGNPGPPGIPADFGASGLGERLVPPGKGGNPRGGTPEPPGEGKTFQAVAEGQPRVTCGEESSEPVGEGKS